MQEEREMRNSTQEILMFRFLKVRFRVVGPILPLGWIHLSVAALLLTVLTASALGPHEVVLLVTRLPVFD